MVPYEFQVSRGYLVSKTKQHNHSEAYRIVAVVTLPPLLPCLLHSFLFHEGINLTINSDLTELQIAVDSKRMTTFTPSQHRRPCLGVFMCVSSFTSIVVGFQYI